MIDYGDTEKNPKLKEIFDLLLLYGYFRIRIPSISIFDKILGGLTWCIQCSNFDIGRETISICFFTNLTRYRLQRRVQPGREGKTKWKGGLGAQVDAVSLPTSRSSNPGSRFPEPLPRLPVADQVRVGDEAIHIYIISINKSINQGVPPRPELEHVPVPWGKALQSRHGVPEEQPKVP